MGGYRSCLPSVLTSLCDSHGVNAQTAFAAISGVLFHSGFGGQLLNLRLGENGVGLSQGRLPSA